MIKKKYLNISEVSEMLGIEEYKIRYWDSIDPKTNKFRIEGLSTKSKGGTRYFNNENIKTLKKLKNILYEGDKQNYSIKLAQKIISTNNKIAIYDGINNANLREADITKKAVQILNKMRLLLNKNDKK